MQMNKISRPFVGADLSAFRGFSQYPVYFVNVYYRVHRRFIGPR